MLNYKDFSDLRLKISNKLYDLENSTMFSSFSPIIKRFDLKNVKTFYIKTFREYYTVEFEDDKKFKNLKIVDRYDKKVGETDLKYLLDSIESYIKFIELNPIHSLNNTIAFALTGGLESEEKLFKSLDTYNIKWSYFSKEFVETLNDVDKKFLVSYNAGSKYNLFESSSDYSYLLDKVKKMSAFSRELLKVGRGFYNWSPVYINDFNDTRIAFNEFQFVSYDNSGNWAVLEDEDKIQEVINSINVTYSYLFEQEEDNKLYNVVRSFINNYNGDYSDFWEKLLDRLLDRKLYKLIKEISWDKDFIKTVNLDNVIKSGKTLDKFNL